MIERIPVSVSLTPELHLFARALVEGGGYGSTSEVVRAGLRLLQQQEAGARPTEPRGQVQPSSSHLADR